MLHPIIRFEIQIGESMPLRHQASQDLTPKFTWIALTFCALGTWKFPSSHISLSIVDTQYLKKLCNCSKHLLECV